MISTTSYLVTKDQSYAPAWRIALGAWVAAFGVGLFTLAAIWAGALVRGHDPGMALG